jgi:hypothetical protein
MLATSGHAPAARGRPGARGRIGRELQRRRAAHDAVELVDRAVDRRAGVAQPRGLAGAVGQLVAMHQRLLGPGRGHRASTSLRGLELEALQAQHVAQHAQHLPGRARFAQRLDHGVEALHAAFGVDEGARRLGPRRDRQQHVAESKPGWP